MSGRQEGESIRLVLIGASGRMGVQILRLLHEMPRYRLVGAVVSPRSSALGQDAGRHAGGLQGLQGLQGPATGECRCPARSCRSWRRRTWRSIFPMVRRLGHTSAPAWPRACHC